MMFTVGKNRTPASLRWSYPSVRTFQGQQSVHSTLRKILNWKSYAPGGKRGHLSRDCNVPRNEWVKSQTQNGTQGQGTGLDNGPGWQIFLLSAWQTVKLQHIREWALVKALISWAARSSMSMIKAKYCSGSQAWWSYNFVISKQTSHNAWSCLSRSLFSRSARHEKLHFSMTWLGYCCACRKENLGNGTLPPSKKVRYQKPKLTLEALQVRVYSVKSGQVATISNWDLAGSYAMLSMMSSRNSLSQSCLISRYPGCSGSCWLYGHIKNEKDRDYW